MTDQEIKQNVGAKHRLRNNDFIQVPFITKAWGTAMDFVGIASPELLSPFADRFVGNNDPPVGQHVFNHAKAQGKAELPPHSFGDDLGWKTMAVIK
ncbi:hypothetical protein J3U99_21155 [Brucella pituitosa]|nr:hypothetical protein [Brucella pituitosa]